MVFEGEGNRPLQGVSNHSPDNSRSPWEQTMEGPLRREGCAFSRANWAQPLRGRKTGIFLALPLEDSDSVGNAASRPGSVGPCCPLDLCHLPREVDVTQNHRDPQNHTLFPAFPNLRIRTRKPRREGLHSALFGSQLKRSGARIGRAGTAGEKASSRRARDDRRRFHSWDVAQPQQYSGQA